MLCPFSSRPYLCACRASLLCILFSKLRDCRLSGPQMSPTDFGGPRCTPQGEKRRSRIQDATNKRTAPKTYANALRKHAARTQLASRTDFCEPRCTPQSEKKNDAPGSKMPSIKQQLENTDANSLGKHEARTQQSSPTDCGGPRCAPQVALTKAPKSER